MTPEIALAAGIGAGVIVAWEVGKAAWSKANGSNNRSYDPSLCRTHDAEIASLRTLAKTVDHRLERIDNQVTKIHERIDQLRETPKGKGS